MDHTTQEYTGDETHACKWLPIVGKKNIHIQINNMKSNLKVL